MLIRHKFMFVTGILLVIISSVSLAYIALPATGGRLPQFAILSLTPATPASCPQFYYYGSNNQCTPQLLSPACSANSPNSPIFFTCSGTTTSPTVCTNVGYAYTNNMCVLTTPSQTMGATAPQIQSTSPITLPVIPANIGLATVQSTMILSIASMLAIGFGITGRSLIK